MYALIALLHNTKNDSYHPIFYFDSPFPGGFGGGSANDALLRYKSKGHHTAGFGAHENALNEIDVTEEKLKSMGYTVTVEKEPMLEWDGIDLPTDIQLRPYPANAIKSTTP